MVMSITVMIDPRTMTMAIARTPGLLPGGRVPCPSRRGRRSGMDAVVIEEVLSWRPEAGVGGWRV
jgi:hypothetical protein